MSKEPSSPIQEKQASACCSEPAQTASCCSPLPKASACCSEESRAATDCNADDAYQQFLTAVNTPGKLDAFTKQAINIALAVGARCEPCLKAHIQKARQNGFSPEEIEEAAMMGVAFGGSPALVMYARIKNSKS